MNAELPPMVKSGAEPGAPSNPPTNLGRVGMALSFVAPAVFLVFLLLRPG